MDLSSDENWRRRAVCATEDPDLFHSESEADTLAAQALCFTCPVSWDCLAWAVETGQKSGVWGGLDFTTWRPR